jgi:D-glycero-alpha-D-manno-heptose-7-phosphate kinase
VIERWRVPVRIDLAGGTLDLWPIYAMLGGCVTVNAAVDLWLRIDIEREADGVSVWSEDLTEGFHGPHWPSEPPAHLRWVWRVLNAVPGRPASFRLSSPVPKGSGLGVSSCLGVGLIGSSRNMEAGPDLADQVPMLRDLEALELQTPTGWQDYYPAALGGCLAIRWGTEIRWERLRPHPELLDDLVVFYTGTPHHSGLTNWEAYRRFMDGDPATRSALEEIRDIAGEMAHAVPQDPLYVAELLEREGRARCRMSPAVETEAMRAVRNRGKRDGWYAGMKPCGAGGGGCCVLVARKGRRDEAKDALLDMGLRPLDMGLTELGLHRQDTGRGE